jgi:hypothetical protein
MGAGRRRLAAATGCFGTPIGARDGLQMTTFQHGRQGDAATACPQHCSRPRSAAVRHWPTMTLTRASHRGIRCHEDAVASACQLRHHCHSLLDSVFSAAACRRCYSWRHAAAARAGGGGFAFDAEPGACENCRCHCGGGRVGAASAGVLGVGASHARARDWAKTF